MVFAGLMLTFLLAGCGKKNYDPSGFQVSDVYVAPEQKSEIDISGCDTFTQIVDSIEDGMGYANVTLGDTDVLLISSGTFEYEPGKQAAIDAEIFYYHDGVPEYIGTVASGGTANPLTVEDGNLFAGGHHFVCSYLVDSGNLMVLEEGYIQYDSKGNDSYYYKTCNSVFEDYDEDTAKQRFDELLSRSLDADVIEFQRVGG